MVTLVILIYPGHSIAVMQSKGSDTPGTSLCSFPCNLILDDEEERRRREEEFFRKMEELHQAVDQGLEPFIMEPFHPIHPQDQEERQKSERDEEERRKREEADRDFFRKMEELNQAAEKGLEPFHSVHPQDKIR